MFFLIKSLQVNTWKGKLRLTKWVKETPHLLHIHSLKWCHWFHVPLHGEKGGGEAGFLEKLCCCLLAFFPSCWDFFGKFWWLCLFDVMWKCQQNVLDNNACCVLKWSFNGLLSEASRSSTIQSHHQELQPSKGTLGQGNMASQPLQVQEKL